MIQVAPELLPGEPGGDPAERIRRLLAGAGLEVERARILRDGRAEGRVAFASLEALCRAELLDRRCSHQPRPEGGFEIGLTVTPPAGGSGEARIQLRPEARITGHNSDGPIRRGNRLRWTFPLDAGTAGSRELRVTTDDVSVLGSTVRTVLRAAAISGGIAMSGLTLLFLVGRRRLRRAARSGAAPDP